MSLPAGIAGSGVWKPLQVLNSQVNPPNKINESNAANHQPWLTELPLSFIDRLVSMMAKIIKIVIAPM
jgi:hypothetical protein